MRSELANDRLPTWHELAETAIGRAKSGEDRSPASGTGVNAGRLITAAHDAGWDVIIPGTGYDLSLGHGRPPTTAVVLSGPSVRLRLPATVSAAQATDNTEPAPTSFLLRVPELAMFEGGFYEATFHCKPDDSLAFVTYDLDIVSPEANWGVPDFREPIAGWASWLRDELIVAWSEAGNDDQGAKKLTLSELEHGPSDARFFVALARAIVLARTQDDGI